MCGTPEDGGKVDEDGNKEARDDGDGHEGPKFVDDCVELE